MPRFVLLLVLVCLALFGAGNRAEARVSAGQKTASGVFANPPPGHVGENEPQANEPHRVDAVVYGKTASGRGNFLSPDPFGHASDMSLYGYANGDPVNRFDSDGRFSKDLWGNPYPDTNSWYARLLTDIGGPLSIQDRAFIKAMNYAPDDFEGAYYGQLAQLAQASGDRELERAAVDALIGIVNSDASAIPGNLAIGLASGFGPSIERTLLRTVANIGGGVRIVGSGESLSALGNRGAITIGGFAEDEMVSLWKGPARTNEVGGRLITRNPALEVVEGFDPALYPGKGPYFGIGEAGKAEALSWANYYKNGLQEIRIPKAAYDDLFKRGVIKVDDLYDIGTSVHVPAEGLPAFNSSISGGVYTPH